MNKWILHTLIIIILALIILAIFPKSIGDDNPVDGFVYSCYGYKFKVLKESWIYKGKEFKTYGYYCLGIPYDYNSRNNCFKHYPFISGYCNYGF